MINSMMKENVSNKNLPEGNQTLSVKHIVDYDSALPRKSSLPFIDRPRNTTPIIDMEEVMNKEGHLQDEEGIDSLDSGEGGHMA